MTQGDGETITYNAFNKPATISSGSTSSSFTYGADLMRYKQVTPSGSTILYIDKLMEIETLGSAADYRHYLGDVAILTKTGSLNDNNPGVKYTFRDRLGGVAMLGDKSGSITEYRGYDAFGKPRNSNWSDKTTPTIASAVTDRGFTDHEHLDDWQLIHMNGRGYDYNLGRFLSVDPFIQEPGNSQSINGYSYIMNNPLSGTDPTGYFGITGSRLPGGSISGSFNGLPAGGGGGPLHAPEKNFTPQLNGKESAPTSTSDQPEPGSATVPDEIGSNARSSARGSSDTEESRPTFVTPQQVEDYLSERENLTSKMKTVQMANQTLSGNDFGQDAAAGVLSAQIADLDRSFACAANGCGEVATSTPILNVLAAGGLLRGGLRVLASSRVAPSILGEIRSSGGMMAINRGTLNAQDLAALSRATGNEFAIFRDRVTGQLFVRELGPIGGRIPANSRLIIHTQPGSTATAVIPSAADRAALTAFGQRSSVIINETGTHAIRFGSSPAVDNAIRSISP